MIEHHEYSIVSNKFLGITVQPYPIDESDNLDSNCTLPEQFVDYMKSEHLDQILDVTNAMCSGHKANVPLA